MKRRSFLRKAGFSTLASVAGVHVVFASNIPEGYELLAFQDPDPFELFDLDSSMVVLNNRPYGLICCFSSRSARSLAAVR